MPKIARNVWENGEIEKITAPLRCKTSRPYFVCKRCNRRQTCCANMKTIGEVLIFFYFFTKNVWDFMSSKDVLEV